MKILKQLIPAALLGLSYVASAAAGPQHSPLVSSEWLNSHLGSDDLVVVDVRSGIDGTDAEGFANGHIPGAVYASYTAAGWRVADGSVPGVLPPVGDLENLIGNLGISNNDRVVVVPAGVGSTDFGSAARVYWTFKYLGHDDVAILDGGFRAWVESGGEVSTGTPSIDPARFEANVRPELLADTDAVEEIQAAGGQLVDARPADQFAGDAKHPASTRAGTIPGALSLEEGLLVREGSAFFLDADDVNELIRTAGIRSDEPAVSFCNTGHWAATAWFALSEIAGFDNVAMYDGSMTEWSQDDAREIVRGQQALSELLN